MNIVKLEAENIKRLKAVRITPTGPVVVIGGKNDQGKTSVIDSIAMALEGAEAIPSKPIREGEEKAIVLVDLDEIVVSRVFTRHGSRVEVKNKEGTVFKSPQTVLDKLASKLTFDPLAFAKMKADKQVETLREFVGLDLSVFDQEIKRNYDARTDANREVKSLDARIKAMPIHKGLPDKAPDTKALGEELQRRMEVNQQNKERKERLEGLATLAADVQKEIVHNEALLAELKAKLATHIEEIAEKTREIETQQDENTEEIQTQISEATDITMKMNDNDRRSQLLKEYSEKVHRSEELTTKIEDLEKQKKELIANADLPVEGLSFDEAAIYIDGIPFDQLSSSRQLKLSVAMGLAMNPKLKILLIRDGSLLDEDNLKLIEKMAAEAGGQVWIERVSEGKEVSVIIEDGEVKG